MSESNSTDEKRIKAIREQLETFDKLTDQQIQNNICWAFIICKFCNEVANLDFEQAQTCRSLVKREVELHPHEDVSGEILFNNEIYG